MLHDGLLLPDGKDRAGVHAVGEFPRPPARRAEPAGQGLRLHGGHVPQGVESEAAQVRPDPGGNGQEVHRVGRQEGGGVGRDPDRPQGAGGAGRHEGGELGVGHSGPGLQVLGRRVQQGVDRPGLAAVQVFQPVQAGVGRAQLVPLHPVADSLQGGEHPVEDPAVGGLVGFQERAAGLAGPGLLQGHARGYAGGGREAVSDQGPSPGTVDDQCGPVLQVGVPVQLHPGPQVGDQHAGDPQEAPATGESWATAIGPAGNADRPRGVRTVLRAEPGTRVRNPSSSSCRRLGKATEALLRPQPLVISRMAGGYGLPEAKSRTKARIRTCRGVSGRWSPEPAPAASPWAPSAVFIRSCPRGLWSGIALRR